MKLKKPEDEKYFKDVVLHNILDEISMETGAPKTSELKQQKKQRKRSLLKPVFFIVFALLCLFFMIVIFNLFQNATTQKNPYLPTSTRPLAHSEIEKPKQDKKILKQKTSTHQHTSKPHIQQKIHPRTIELHSPKTPVVPRKKTEHELAKEALRRQLLQ